MAKRRMRRRQPSRKARWEMKAEKLSARLASLTSKAATADRVYREALTEHNAAVRGGRSPDPTSLRRKWAKAQQLKKRAESTGEAYDEAYTEAYT